MKIREHIKANQVTATITGTQRAVDAQVQSYRKGSIPVVDEKRRAGKAVLVLRDEKPIVAAGDEFVLSVEF